MEVKISVKMLNYLISYVRFAMCYEIGCMLLEVCKFCVMYELCDVRYERRTCVCCVSMYIEYDA
jgi:hypothetical protein